LALGLGQIRRSSAWSGRFIREALKSYHASLFAPSEIIIASFVYLLFVCSVRAAAFSLQFG
jgi:hypothetical protein